jgi:hypothetical protein
VVSRLGSDDQKIISVIFPLKSARDVFMLFRPIRGGWHVEEALPSQRDRRQTAGCLDPAVYHSVCPGAWRMYRDSINVIQ